MARKLVIPDWIRYACSGCGLCCRRGWDIHVTPKDRERYLAVDWSDEFPDGDVSDFFDPAGSEWRFAVDDDGRCRFLGADGLCVMHRKLGFDAKTYACKAYPVYFVYTGREVRVGAHYSCSAVADDDGPPLTAQRRAIEKQLACQEEIWPPPPVTDECAFDAERPMRFDDLRRIDEVFDRALTAEMPFLRRVVFASRFIDAVAERYDPEMKRAAVASLVEHLERNARDHAVNAGLRRERLGPLERLMVRQMCGLASELAVQGLLSRKFMRRQEARVRRLMLAARFLVGRGRFSVGGRDAVFSEIADVRAWPLPEDAEDLLERWMRTRFAARAYFGSEGWGLPVLQGARLFLSLFGVVIWLARAHAAASDRDAVVHEDVRMGVMLAEYSFGHMSSLHLGPIRAALSAVNRERWAERVTLNTALPET